MDPTNRGGPQSQRNWAWRDYGNRVGNFRLFRMLDELKLPATILLNSEVCEHYPKSSSASSSAATMSAATAVPTPKRSRACGRPTSAG